MINLQIPDTVVMVRPLSFGYNEQTAGSNTFQSDQEGIPDEIHRQAVEEFNVLASQLKSASVEVYIFDDNSKGDTPDSVFPNNWISFHPDGSVVLYPMLAPNRRKERRMDIPEALRESFRLNRVIDLTGHEAENKFLEGTGSVVFDHINRVAYANRSPRTNEELFNELCEVLGYESCLFKAFDRSGKDIYHTNVMMNIGTEFAVLCTEAISDEDRSRVIGLLTDTSHQLVEINYMQMEHFAGNMIQLAGRTSKQNFLVMSDQAYQSLLEDQVDVLNHYNTILHTPLNTIEANGGGSARCMIAGVHLPRKKL